MDDLRNSSCLAKKIAKLLQIIFANCFNHATRQAKKKRVLPLWVSLFICRSFVEQTRDTFSVPCECEATTGVAARQWNNYFCLVTAFFSLAFAAAWWKFGEKKFLSLRQHSGEKEFYRLLLVQQNGVRSVSVQVNRLLVKQNFGDDILFYYSLNVSFFGDLPKWNGDSNRWPSVRRRLNDQSRQTPPWTCPNTRSLFTNL